MERETDTPDHGTDNAQPLETDTPEDWDYFDPEEDTEEVTEEDGTDDEEQAEEPETEEQSEDDDEAAEEDADEHPEEKAPGLVTLADGTEVTHDELIKGYIRQADYTRKQQVVSSKRNSVEADAKRIERITDAFVDQLVQMLPPEPSPELAYTDAAKFTAQKASYDTAIAQVQQIIKTAEQPKEIKDRFSKEDHDSMLAEETQKLNEALPETATREGKKAFWDSTVKSVAEEIGFSGPELEGMTDHRMFLLAHWAKKGMEADKAKAKVKAKAEKAAPASPRKPGQPAKRANRNADAMKKLSRTGSMQDALLIDFE